MHTSLKKMCNGSYEVLRKDYIFTLEKTIRKCEKIIF